MNRDFQFGSDHMNVSVLTISSMASLAAVTDNTNTRGTTVVNQDRDDIAGITYNKQS